MEAPPTSSILTPQSAVTAASRLDLRFRAENASTRLTVVRQDPPWRAIRAFRNPNGEAVVHLHNISGGILSGDTLDLAIDAGRGARVQVTTVGATRVYRHRNGRADARLTSRISVDRGATVEYLPDPLIPFARSRMTQSTSVSLGLDAGYIGWETIAAGRTSSGEEFAFDLLRSEFSIRSEDHPLAIERFELCPSLRDPRSLARWGQFRYTGTLYVCHTGVDASAWLSLESRLNDLASSLTTGDVRWAASTLVASGLVVRGIAREAHQIAAGYPLFWDYAKQEIWSERAIPPRKIN